MEKGKRLILKEASYTDIKSSLTLTVSRIAVWNVIST
ncbi:unnamed protein product [Haemonchus placei]|uniref:Uncharacterized protein n=1 Tax=Haemonchus placei TaxID=6290 RepID=A0A3P7VP87_HAEPC|nr:unnamed protein product [Haemonchus placei]